MTFMIHVIVSYASNNSCMQFSLANCTYLPMLWLQVVQRLTLGFKFR